MKPDYKEGGLAVLMVLGSAALSALGGLLGKILEPTFKWVLFATMKLAIKWLPPGKMEDTIKALYKEYKASYGEK